MQALSASTLAALALAVLAPEAATAAPPAPGARQSADQTAEAKARFRRGTELYRQARYREAIAEFQAAYRLRPHGVLHFNIAQCHEKLGDIPAALASYHDYLREVPGAEDRETVQRAMTNLEARLAATGVQQILVYSEPAGAEVLVDGQSRGRTPFSMVLPHGTHVVSLVKAGYETVTRQVALAPDRSLQLDFALVTGATASQAPSPQVSEQPSPPGRELSGTAKAPEGKVASQQPSPPGRGQLGSPSSKEGEGAPRAALVPAPAPKPVARGGKLWTWVAGGAAVAAAGAGIWFGMQARDASDKLVNASQPLPPGDAQRLYDDARSKSRTANVLYGVAGALGAAGVTLFFLEGSF